MKIAASKNISENDDYEKYISGMLLIMITIIRSFVFVAKMPKWP